MSVQCPPAVLPPLVDKEQRALQQAVAGVIMEHRRSGMPLVVWQNGRVAFVDPESVPLTLAGEPPDVHEGE